MQLCLGAIYAWSVFVKPLKETFAYSTTQTQVIFSVGLATFALVMIFAGKWQDKKGPRLVGTVGGVFLGVGYILASYTNAAFLPLALAVGVVGGAGIGLAYVCPIAACVKWFPDKRGLVTGLAVAGFGAGAWIFARIAANFITAYGLMTTFQYLGLIFLVAVVFGAQFLHNPPEGWKPIGWVNHSEKKKASKENYTWREMVGTIQFWMLWLMFVFGAGAGLMVIGILKPFGVFSGLTEAAAVSAVGVLALFNGAGRIIWGVASDKLGRTKAMSLMFFLQGLMVLALMRMGASELLLSIAVAWIGFNFGGNFALFPSATADYFGTKHIGVNYGFVFTSYGIAGIFGPILGGWVFDTTGTYTMALIPAGVLCLVASGLALVLKHPHKQ